MDDKPPNPCPNAEPEDLRKFIIEMFGEDSVKRIDEQWEIMHNIRLTADTNLDFLKGARDHFGEKDGEVVVAALLYGMKVGELAATVAMRQEQIPASRNLPAPGHYHAT
jgi:hypothetical protein